MNDSELNLAKVIEQCLTPLKAWLESIYEILETIAELLTEENRA